MTARREPAGGVATGTGAATAPGTVVPDRAWFTRDVLVVARGLLGALLTRRTPQGAVTVRITEVEAYAGPDDPGSHAYRGETARNRTMFGEPGRVYVYRHLGLHHCMNVVCSPPGEASAVLLRAGEVVEGVELARARRAAAGVTRSDPDLARGPARLTVALAVDREDDGADVTDPAGDLVLRVPATSPDRGGQRIATGPRVGVSGEGGRADLFPWRAWLDGDPAVSVYRAAESRRRRR
ncbi:DNA-3-methyladenine glycosylase [Krasilnikoviella flava]|uniref:Putative 3-methyladenine DNA glycosylase n=1 Tax=Krasilnikoviella flava TaxID=526729 RepID=A0A1T5LUY3_9MICO|nr:DNA-3-methyladenine glycosylase [Krasilnikoviella flava]SKC79837.1 DNA-3-methyladenine glycosylase [Krasilnikoviella flava]